MTALLSAMLIVLVCDLAVKDMLARKLGSDAVSLGPLGALRVVTGRLWLRQQFGNSSAATTWAIWLTAAMTLTVASSRIPGSEMFVGMLLGGALSNAIEFEQKGKVSDYVCLRFWPAFNLADVALAVGAVGTLASLIVAVLRRAS